MDDKGDSHTRDLVRVTLSTSRRDLDSNLDGTFHKEIHRVKIDLVNLNEVSVGYYKTLLLVKQRVKRNTYYNRHDSFR